MYNQLLKLQILPVQHGFELVGPLIHGFFFFTNLHYSTNSLVAHRVKNPPAKEETACNAGIWVQSSGQENPLEMEMASHSSILIWEIPWTDYCSWRHKSQTQLSD